MKKTLIVLLAVVFVASFALGARAADEKVIKIGGASPLSGPVAYWGISTTQAWEDGADVINARGGVKIGKDYYKLKIITYDTKGEVKDSRAATTRLVEQDKVKYVYSQAAASTIGMLEVTEPNKVLSMVACWGYIELEGPKYFYHYRAEMSDYEQGFAYMPWMKSYYKGLKTAAFIGPDDKDGYDCYFSYQRLMKYYNVEDMGKEYFNWEDTDFYPIVTKVLTKKPDFIVTSPTPPGITASIVKAAREMGYKGPIVSPGASETKTILEVAKEYADGVVLPVTLESGVTPYQKALKERFTKHFGSFNAYAGNLSWWVYSLAKAFEDAGTFEDTTAVANALEKVVLKDTYVGTAMWKGKGQYGANRQGVYDCYTTLIEKGKARVADVRFPELPPGY